MADPKGPNDPYPPESKWPERRDRDTNCSNRPRWQDDPVVQALLGHRWANTLGIMEDAVEAYQRHLVWHFENATLEVGDSEESIGWWKTSHVVEEIRRV